MATREERRAYQMRLKKFKEAAVRSDLETMRAILEEDSKVLEEDTPMLDACLYGQPKAVKFMLDHGALAEPAGEYAPRRPLIRAIVRTKSVSWTHGHRQVVELLLNRDVHTGPEQSWNGQTALSAAASVGNREAIDMLLARNPTVDIFDAAALADSDRADQFLRGDPGLAKANSAGYATALHYCAYSALGADDPDAAKRLAKIAETLISLGSPIEPVKVEGNVTYSALTLACLVGNEAVAGVLLQNGADANEALEPALGRQHLNILDMMVKYAGELNLNRRTGNKLRNPLLNELIRWGSLKSAGWLLAQGVKPTETDTNGWTALHYASRRGVNTDLLQELLNHGTEINARTKEDKTSLGIARERKKQKIVAFLEEYGATE